ncbi:8138_t:CDS:2, partial [Paraglomus occultum]
GLLHRTAMTDAFPSIRSEGGNFRSAEFVISRPSLVHLAPLKPELIGILFATEYQLPESQHELRIKHDTFLYESGKTYQQS